MTRISDYEGDKTKIYSGSGRGEIFTEILSRRISRRAFVTGSAVGVVVVVGLAIPRPQPETLDSPDLRSDASFAPGAGLNFSAIQSNGSENTRIADGYTAVPFLRWGDPIIAGAPEFDPDNQTASAQAQQFGYNCDWIGFMPFSQDSPDHGLLVVNHEYTNPELMFSDYPIDNPDPAQQTIDIELEAHGLSIVEIVRDAGGAWELVRNSRYNRRITGTTPMMITGPAAGHDLMKTSADPTGTHVTGTLNNCAGGMTPWGTILSSEENFQQYFANLDALPADDPRRALHERFGVREEASERHWESVYSRFDLAEEPNEPFRFGWGVEIDPFDPTFTPLKRTALGRNKHEGHTSTVAPGGQVAIYSGDDERFEYAYKFVTSMPYNPTDWTANMTLLDDGTLYVATFYDDGTGEWRPLVYGTGDLTTDNGFSSQGDVLINTRIAADLVGATRMDRPEDFETNPITGKVYLVCTGNTLRDADDVDEANPRPDNVHGHVIELTEDGDDHAATTFTWELFLLCGDPADDSTWYAGFDRELVSPISVPDNLTFDLQGNIWIATGGNELGGNAGLFVAPTEGTERGYVRQFFSAVPGAEVTGPVFNPDNVALFLSVQHPGQGGTYAEPITQWPDGDGPARPSVVLIQREDGGRIGE